MELSQLESGWLDGKGFRLSRGALWAARSIVEGLQGEGIPGPEIFPIANGGIELSWKGVEWDVEVIFSDDLERIYAYATHRESHKDVASEWEAFTARLQVQTFLNKYLLRKEIL